MYTAKPPCVSGILEKKIIVTFSINKESHQGYVIKLPVGFSVVFAGYSGFLHQLQLANHDLAAIWQKKYKKRNSKLNQ